MSNTIDGAAAASLLPGQWVPPAGVRVVVFDVVGTLVEPHPSVAVAYQQAGLRQGVGCDSADIQRRFAWAWRQQELLDAAAVPSFATSQAREEERWRRIVEEVFAGAASLEQTAAIFADLWDHFGEPSSWRPVAAGQQMLQATLQAGVGVVLASNFDDRLLRLAKHLHPLTSAQEVFASSAIGWRKPAPEFFRWIEARLGCRPDELMLVGDNPLLDIAAATQAGWQAQAVA